MERGNRNTRDEEVEKEGEWGSSTSGRRKEERRGEEDRWSEGRERKAGMERGEGRAWC